MTHPELAAEVARRLGVAAHPATVQIAEAVALFAPLGWAMCGRWHQAGTVRALQLAAAGADSAAIDEAIAEVWNSENQVLLRHAATPIRGWSSSHYPFMQMLWDRVALIDKAIQHHLAGAYEASIPILLAQIDGLSFDLTGRSFFSRINADPFIDDATLAGMEANLPVVRRIFSESVNESGRFGRLSRHGVLHGRDLGYATRVNSTKTIVLIAALAEYFPRVADVAGARLRRAHEESVAGVQGFDESGRLIDDRHVPELLNFAFDFDTEYLTAVLLGGGPFDASRTRSEIARKHHLDPDAFIVGQDQTGCWWHYTLPAGHTLGYAARPTTSTKRHHPDVWRWDDSRTPAGPPWVNVEGWRSDDDFPRSPNWEPEPVI